MPVCYLEPATRKAADLGMYPADVHVAAHVDVSLGGSSYGGRILAAIHPVSISDSGDTEAGPPTHVEAGRPLIAGNAGGFIRPTYIPVWMRGHTQNGVPIIALIRKSNSRIAIRFQSPIPRGSLLGSSLLRQLENRFRVVLILIAMGFTRMVPGWIRTGWARPGTNLAPSFRTRGSGAGAITPRQGPESARREDRCQHGMVGIRVELLVCLHERLNRPRPLRMPKSASVDLAEPEKQGKGTGIETGPIDDGNLYHSRNRVITGKVQIILMPEHRLQNCALLRAHPSHIPYGLQDPGIPVSGHATPQNTIQ